MRKKRLRRGARLAAELLAAAAAASLLLEAGLRLAPRLAPDRLRLEALRESLLGRLSADPELGVALPAPYERRAAWEGGLVRLRHLPFPGQTKLGYRAGAEGGDPTKVDIAALGDSHAYGLEVDEDATWESRLSRLTSSSVVNLALPYQGTAQETALYRRYGAKFHPRLVLMTICPNDYWDNEVFRAWQSQKEGGERDFRHYKFRTLLGRPEPLATLAHWAYRSMLLQHLHAPARHRRYLKLSRRAASSPREMEALIADVREAGALASAGGARFAAILTDIWWSDDFGPLRGPLKKALRKKGIPVLDLGKRLCAQGGCPHELTLPNDLHWNERGHARVAEEIARFLRERRLLPGRGRRG